LFCVLQRSADFVLFDADEVSEALAAFPDLESCGENGESGDKAEADAQDREDAHFANAAKTGKSKGAEANNGGER